VDGILLDAGGEVFPDRPRFGLGGIRRPHEPTDLGNCSRRLQDDGHDGPRRHELGQTGEERFPAMNPVKLFGLLPIEVDHLQRPDRQEC